MKPRTDLAIVAALALIACVFAAVLPSSVAVLRALLCLPLVLVAPGYALVSALFPPAQLRPAELGALSIAFSVAAAILSGLLLDELGIKLTAAPWMGLLALLTLAACAYAASRGHARALVWRAPALRGAHTAAIAASIALLAGAAALGFTPLGPPTSTSGTTALTLLPAPGGAQAVCVGIINEQFHTTSYTVSLTVDGVGVDRLGPITLTPGASWSRLVPVAAPRPQVSVTLSTTSDPLAVYRQVWLRDWNVHVVAC